ncbi:hypothetical protein [Caviibacter abscessus]|uniref:hypothetical protein n=1 Tax=Caviibacter abscessus TaxID=1766719 RepID=UPI000835B339|nr:hypothetical protein [Caviibacter abscessus]
MSNFNLALKLKSDNLTFFEIFSLTYIAIFNNIILIAPIVLLYLIFVKYDVSNYDMYLTIIYIFTIEVLDYAIFKRRQKKFISFMVAYVIMGFMMILFKVFIVFFIYFVYAILIRGVNIKQAAIVLKRMLSLNFVTIFFTNIVHIIIIAILSGFITTFVISNMNDVNITQEFLQNFVIKNTAYYNLAVHLVLAINSYVLYNYFERKNIIKGE